MRPDAIISSGNILAICYVVDMEIEHNLWASEVSLGGKPIDAIVSESRSKIEEREKEQTFGMKGSRAETH